MAVGNAEIEHDPFLLQQINSFSQISNTLTYGVSLFKDSCLNQLNTYTGEIQN